MWNSTLCCWKLDRENNEQMYLSWKMYKWTQQTRSFLSIIKDACDGNFSAYFLSPLCLIVLKVLCSFDLLSCFCIPAPES